MKTKIGPGDWVVVCDGRKALILLNKGDETFPNLRTKEVREHNDALTSAQGADAPGRVQASYGSARSAVGQTDWHDEAERSFLHALVHHLDSTMKPNEPRSIVMVAAPRALGMLRKSYTPALRERIKTEIGKDYVALPVHQIEKHLLADLGISSSL